MSKGVRAQDKDQNTQDRDNHPSQGANISKGPRGSEGMCTKHVVCYPSIHEAFREEQLLSFIDTITVKIPRR